MTGDRITVGDFAVTAVEAGVIPDLTPDQQMFLGVLDGADRIHTTFNAQRAGRRHMRAIVAAYFISRGATVDFYGDNAEQARQDALEILDGLDAAGYSPNTNRRTA